MSKILSVIVFAGGVLIPVACHFTMFSLIVFSVAGGMISRLLWDYDKE
jgi:hypothetical protein